MIGVYGGFLKCGYPKIWTVFDGIPIKVDDFRKPPYVWDGLTNSASLQPLPWPPAWEPNRYAEANEEDAEAKPRNVARREAMLICGG